MSKKLQLLNQVGIKADYKDGDLSLETSGFIISPVTSVNGMTGDVIITEGGQAVEIPVTSVNGQIGDVNITASGIGAATTSDVEQLQSQIEDVSTLVGDIAVSEQINIAIASKADSAHTHSEATTSAAGLMSSSDKSKLDDIAASADSVSFSQSLTSGTKVGTITINGTGTDLYAPTNTDTHYTTGLKVGASSSDTANAAASNGSVYLNVLDNTTVRDSHKITGSGATTVTSDANGVITVSSTDTTYGIATTSANGLMSKTDKSTLDNLNTLVGDTPVATQINNYAAPKGHASSATTYGVSSASNYGHAKASGTTPKANGTAAVGAETSSFARGDHVHPLQTSVSGNAGTATTLQTARTVQTNLGSTSAASFNGSANITPGVTGTLPLANGGTSATSASGALSNIGAAAASHTHNYIPLSGSSSITGDLEFSNSGTTARGVIGTTGDNDYWRVVGGATATNGGYLEIATADDASEPIYVRQYGSGKFGTLTRTATLLDASGNTSFPGTVSSKGANVYTTSTLQFSLSGTTLTITKS